MTNVLEHVEAALAEVTKAREAVTRAKTKQVRASEKRDSLKAVALAWLRTHNPALSDFETAPVDEPMRVVLAGTARSTAKSKYLQALGDAKLALIELRNTVASRPPETEGTLASAAVSYGDARPAFEVLTADVRMQGVLRRRWDEIRACLDARAYMAAAVMIGGLLETMLLARFNVETDKKAIYSAKGSPKDKKTGKPIDLANWKLDSMVNVAHDLRWISKSHRDVGHVLRDFRNFIHPEKELSEGVEITERDARLFWTVCKAITDEVLTSVGTSPGTK